MNRFTIRHAVSCCALCLPPLLSGGCSHPKKASQEASGPQPEGKADLRELRAPEEKDSDGSLPSTELPGPEQDLEEQKELAPSPMESESPDSEPAADEMVVPRARERGASLSRLTSEEEILDRALHPERLTCEGAAPHRDAICEIAARLCDTADRSSTEERQQCESAKKSCKKAQKRFDQSCS